MRKIDAHSHINVVFKEFYSDFLKNTASKGTVSIFVNSQTPDEASFLSLINFRKKNLSNFPNLLFFSALHPWHTETLEKWENRQKKTLEGMLVHNKNLLIGETGLDRLRGADIETQKDIFRSHIELALEYKRPFSIHCVREWGNCTDILSSFFSEDKKEKIPFIVHGFSGSFETMQRLVKIGAYISFSAGMIIRDNKKTLENIIRIDLNRFFIETDFPYSVLDEKGEMTEFKSADQAAGVYTEMLQNAYKKAADILNISTAELGRIIEENGKIFTDYTASRRRELQ